MKSISNISGGGSQSGGHTIQNASGTDLPQESTLQFDGYLKASDDSANSKTVVSDTTTISWNDWNELTDVEKEGTHWIITNVPEVDGEVHTDLMTKLWENPNPTADFAAQTVTLASDDYDFLLFDYAYLANGKRFTSIASKGCDGIINVAIQASDIVFGDPMRTITYNTATSISISDCSYQAIQNGGAVSTATNNSNLIPIAIYGFKKTITIDTSALIANVSTDASKCILSDGVTSVEDALNNTVTLTPLSPNTITNYSAGQNGRLVVGTCRMALTASANTETKVGTIDKKPTNDIHCLAYNTGNFAVGRVTIYSSSGNVNVQFTSALSASNVSFTFAYTTND